MGGLLIAAVLAVVVAVNREPLVAVVGLFVLVVPFEKLFPRHRQPLRRPGLGTDLAYALGAPLLGAAGLVVGVVIGLVSLAWLPGLALRPLVSQLPPTAHIVAAVLLFDFATYWVHRWSHEVPFLWRFHSVHHSTGQLDWISGLRVHPFDGALVAPPFAFLVGAGFDPEVAGVLAVVQLLVGLFLHANVRWRWRPLQRLVNTPEMHHWHHADQPEAHNRNYAALLPVWDQLFGTFYIPADLRPQVYGVTPPLPDGLVAQLRHPFRGLVRPRWVAAHPLRAMRRMNAAVLRGLTQITQSTLGRAATVAAAEQPMAGG